MTDSTFSRKQLAIALLAIVAIVTHLILRFGVSAAAGVYNIPLFAALAPVAVALGLAAWLISGEAVRFLAVMVVATPCPLLIAIPVAIIGSISLAARRAIASRKCDTWPNWSE